MEKSRSAAQRPIWVGRPFRKSYGSVHKIRAHLGGIGQRFVTKRIGICTVLHYKGGGRSKILKNCVRILCMLSNCDGFVFQKI
jgi:hypothetical protein